MPENEGRFERGMDFFAPLPSTPHSRISLVMLRRGESGVRPYFLPCTCLSATAAMKTTTTAKRESTMLPRSRKRIPRLGEFAIADSAACPRGEPQWIRPRLICSSRRRGQSSPVAKTKFCILELFFWPSHLWRHCKHDTPPRGITLVHCHIYYFLDRYIVGRRGAALCGF